LIFENAGSKQANVVLMLCITPQDNENNAICLLNRQNNFISMSYPLES